MAPTPTERMADPTLTPVEPPVLPPAVLEGPVEEVLEPEGRMELEPEEEGVAPEGVGRAL